MRISDWSSDVCSSDLVDHGEERAADDERVFHIVDFLEQRRRFGPALPTQLPARARAIPDVPFVEREHDPFGGAPLGGDRIGERGAYGDEALGLAAPAQAELDFRPLILALFVRGIVIDPP